MWQCTRYSIFQLISCSVSTQRCGGGGGGGGGGGERCTPQDFRAGECGPFFRRKISRGPPTIKCVLASF